MPFPSSCKNTPPAQISLASASLNGLQKFGAQSNGAFFKHSLDVFKRILTSSIPNKLTVVL